jgi:D-glycero-alpha-D-manno-heptose 1-phosphate guanylyltransferase
MKAIILLGGFGTRLRSVVPDLPKPMAPIGDKPFLAYLLDYLKVQGITTAIFSVHYLREKIQAYFQSNYQGIDIIYAEEMEPLGTGGAMRFAASFVKNNEPVFVLNGDTFVKLDYRGMFQAHQETKAQITMALRTVGDCHRYGKVVVDGDTIIQFYEKGESGPGLINAGVYLIQPNLFFAFNMPASFSFETDFLFPHLVTLKPHPFLADDYFIDIGIPEDYARAQLDLNQSMAEF